MIEVLDNRTTVIIMQYINVSDQRVVYLPHTRLYVNYISIKKRKKSKDVRKRKKDDVHS